MVALKNAMGVVDSLREAAGRSWWGEIGLEGRGNERWLGVHYRDLFGSGRKWRARAIRKNHPDLKGAPQKVDVKLRGEDIYLRDRLLGSIEVLYGLENRTRAEQELGERPLTCRRVRRVVDRIRCEKKAFQRRFFLSGKPDGVDPLPGTFDALVQDLRQERIIPPAFWEKGGEEILRRLAQGIIEQSAEDLSESRRIGEIRENIMTFFTQRQMLWDAAAPLRAVDDPIILQDLDTLFNQFLFHPSVLLLRPQGARGQLMETIWRRYWRFLESNPIGGGEQPQQAGDLPYEARRRSMTQFIFRMPDMPMSFEVTGSLRYRSEMDSYRYLDGGVCYTIFACGRTSPAPFSEPDPSVGVSKGLGVGTVTRQDSLKVPDEQPKMVNFEEKKERKSLESKDRDKEIPIPQDLLRDLELQQKEELPPKVEESKSLEQAKEEALSEAREKFREKYFSRQKPPLDGNYSLIGMTGRYNFRSRVLPNGPYGQLTERHFSQVSYPDDSDFGLVGVEDSEQRLIWPAGPFNAILREVIDTIIDHTEIDELYQMGKDGVIQKLSNFMNDLKWGLALLEESHRYELIILYSTIQDNKSEPDMFTREMLTNTYSFLEITCRKWLAMPAVIHHCSINIGERRHIMTQIIKLCYEYIHSLRALQWPKDLATEEKMCQYVFGKGTLPEKIKVEESREWIYHNWETVVKVDFIYSEDELSEFNDLNSGRTEEKEDSKQIDIEIDIESNSEDSDDDIVYRKDIQHFDDPNGIHQLRDGKTSIKNEYEISGVPAPYGNDDDDNMYEEYGLVIPDPSGDDDSYESINAYYNRK